MSDHANGGLQVRDDDYPAPLYRGQQAGRALLVLIVLASAVGLSGHGPLSWTTAEGSTGQLEVRYEHFGRRGGSQDVTVRATADAAIDGMWHVTFDGDLPDNFQIDAVTPEPESVTADTTGVRYTFEQSGPDADLDAIFAVTPRGMWREEGHISLNDDRVAVWQFIYP